MNHVCLPLAKQCPPPTETVLALGSSLLMSVGLITLLKWVPATRFCAVLIWYWLFTLCFTTFHLFCVSFFLPLATWMCLDVFNGTLPSEWEWECDWFIDSVTPLQCLSHRSQYRSGVSTGSVQMMDLPSCANQPTPLSWPTSSGWWGLDNTVQWSASRQLVEELVKQRCLFFLFSWLDFKLYKRQLFTALQVHSQKKSPRVEVHQRIAEDTGLCFLSTQRNLRHLSG